MRLLVAYDVSDDRRRGRVAGELRRRGRRVQYSVFELPAGEREELRRVLAGLMDASEDRLRIQPLCDSCAGKALEVGSLPGELVGDYRVVG